MYGYKTGVKVFNYILNIAQITIIVKSKKRKYASVYLLKKIPYFFRANLNTLYDFFPYAIKYYSCTLTQDSAVWFYFVCVFLRCRRQKRMYAIRKGLFLLFLPCLKITYKSTNSDFFYNDFGDEVKVVYCERKLTFSFCFLTYRNYQWPWRELN